MPAFIHAVLRPNLALSRKRHLGVLRFVASMPRRLGGETERGFGVAVDLVGVGLRRSFRLTIGGFGCLWSSAWFPVRGRVMNKPCFASFPLFPDRQADGVKLAK